MAALPFGLASEPRAFAALSNWVGTELRQQGSRIVVYLEDFLVAHQNSQVLRDQAQRAVCFLESLGWKMKSVLSLVTVIEFLGICWDPHNNRKFLPADKVTGISGLLAALLYTQSWSSKAATSLVRMLSFTAFAIPLGKLHLRSLQRCLSGLPESTPRKRFSIPLSARTDLLWWTYTVHTQSAIFPPKRFGSLSTDASDSGWGAQVNGQLLQGHWSTEQRQWHINRKEMFAVHQALSRVRAVLARSSVVVQSDNKTVVAYIRNHGGTKSATLVQDVAPLLETAESAGMHLVARLIPGRYNDVADTLSRQLRLPHWHLSADATQPLSETWRAAGDRPLCNNQIGGDPAVVRLPI